MTEGHHGFCSRAVPSRRKIFFEEYYLDIPILCNARGFFIADIQAVYGNRRRSLSEGVYNLSLGEVESRSFLNLAKAIVKIGIRYTIARATQYLNNENGINVSIVLFTAILCPVIPLFFPIVCCCLKNRHIFIERTFLGIGNNDSILQKSRSTNFICRYYDFMYCGGCSFNKTVKALGSSRHTDNNRHRSELVLGTTFKEFLHDSRCTARFTTLHTSMRLVDNQIQTVTLFTCRVGESFPNRILSCVAVLGQIRTFTKLLCVEEIDVSVIQYLTVKGFFRDGNALIKTDFVRLQIYFLLGLLIKLRRVGKPNEDGILLIGITVITEIYRLYQRCHNNGFTRARRSSKGNNLRRVSATIAAKSLGTLHS